MSLASKDDYTLSDYLKEIVADDIRIFNELIRWKKEDYIEFKKLLSNLEKPFDQSQETTKEKGDRLENLVAFIIKKSYFFKIYRNVHTSSNEIDEVICMSDEGKQAISKFGLEPSLLGVDTDIFIGECKNYKKSLGVTYVGKFYSLMIATNTNFGILFTFNGLSGKREEYREAYGLTKILHLVEKYRNQQDFYIIDFTLTDYQKMAEGKTNFYDLIKQKKLELKLASDFSQIVNAHIHDKTEEIREIVSSGTSI